MGMRMHKIKFEGKEYTVSDAGARWFLQTQDACTDAKGKLKQEKFMEALLTCVSPTISMDDLTMKQMGELGDVLQDCFLS